MTNHLKSKHANEWTKVLKDDDEKQPSMYQFVQSKPKSVEKFAINSAKRKSINRKLVKFIAKDQRTITVVRNPGFKELINELEPRYVLPSTQTIKNKLLPEEYKTSMDKLQKDLDSAKFVSLTTDGWTSAATDKYNAFTVHWVDWSKPEIQTKILECAPFEQRSTSEQLEKELRRIIEKYGIENKLVLDVADNASDIQGALEKLGFPRLGCAAHKFNLAAKGVIEKCPKVKDLQTKCSKIVRTTKVSPPAKRALRSCLKRIGIKGKKSLVTYVATRWNSFYLMLDRLREFKDALILYFAQYNIEEPLDEEDWMLIEELCVVLRPLLLATNELSAEKFTTLSKVVPMISLLQETYSKPGVNESETTKMVRKVVADGLKDKFKGIETDQTYANATILDPRFKNLAFPTKSTGSLGVKSAKLDAVSIGHMSRDVSDSDSEILETEKDSNGTDELWGSFDAKMAQKPSTKSLDLVKESVDLEMRQYLSLPLADRKSCPLTWWKNNSKDFPLLFDCAQKYFCMPATSVPSERVFSNAGNIISKKRTLLAKDTANMLITLHSNL